MSIENACKNALDDEIAGAASLLFDRTEGLPTLVARWNTDHADLTPAAIVEPDFA